MILNLLGLPRFWFLSCTPYRGSGIPVSSYSYEKMCLSLLGDSCIPRIPRIPVSPWKNVSGLSGRSSYPSYPSYPRIPMIFKLLGLPRLWFLSCTPYRVSGIPVSLYSYEKMCLVFLGDSRILRIPRISVSPWKYGSGFFGRFLSWKPKRGPSIPISLFTCNMPVLLPGTRFLSVSWYPPYTQQNCF